MHTTFKLFAGVAAVVLAALPAAALDAVGVDQVQFSWSPSSGPVAYYGVFIERNGVAPGDAPNLIVSGTQAAVTGAVGDVVVVRAAAFTEAGSQGPMSSASDPISFLAAPPPPPPPPSDPPDDPDGDAGNTGGDDPPPPDENADDSGNEPPSQAGGPPLYLETFEGYADAEDPVAWFDTGSRNSLNEAPDAFETFELNDGSTAFGTTSTLTNMHSHLDVAGSDGWSSYEFAGLLSIEDPQGGIGLTVYSDYPVSDSYYRLRRHGSDAFHLAHHPHNSGTQCIGSTDSGVVPDAGTWYRFRFQAFPDGNGTRLRAKVWDAGDAEPASWPIDCVDSNAPFAGGTVGVWSMGNGLKLWDDLAVSPVEIETVAEEEVVEPTPEAPETPLPPASGFYADGFEAYGDGDDPVGWFDTAARNSLREAPYLFEVFELNDGSAAFGTASTATNIHSHLLLGDSADWTDYEFSGQLSIDNRKGGIGVTVYSQYPFSDHYYRLRRYNSSSFYLAHHPDRGVQCTGSKRTDVVPVPGAWYRFRFQASAEGNGTRLRAKVWNSTDSEPSGWPIDCLDSNATFTGGAPGVWSMGRGVKLWDDLHVAPIPR